MGNADGYQGKGVVAEAIRKSIKTKDGRVGIATEARDTEFGVRRGEEVRDETEGRRYEFGIIWAGTGATMVKGSAGLTGK